MKTMKYWKDISWIEGLNFKKYRSYTFQVSKTWKVFQQFKNPSV